MVTNVAYCHLFMVHSVLAHRCKGKATKQKERKCWVSSV